MEKNANVLHGFSIMICSLTFAVEDFPIIFMFNSLARLMAASDRFEALFC